MSSQKSKNPSLRSRTLNIFLAVLGKPLSKKRKTIFFILKCLFFCFLFLVLCLLFLFIYYARDLPRPEKFTERRLFQSTKIYDKTGEILLYDIYGEEKREIVSLDQIPDYLKNAVIAAEDAAFYQHRGLDFKGIMRAILVNIKLRKPAQGASTITQQLIRSSFLTRKKTLERKIREVILTLELERRHSKDKILEWYLNQIPLGGNCYGVESASQTYFKKHVSEISLVEAAALASLIQAPSYYISNKDKLLIRKDYILGQMRELGYITEKEEQESRAEKLEFAEILRPGKAPHFVIESSYVKSYLEKKYGEDFLKEKGLKVFTTIDWELQSFAEEIIEDITKNNENYNAYNAALAAIDPRTGEILAMVGSKNYFEESFPEGCEMSEEKCLFEPKFNVATSGKRQPGSAFKPFVYAAAFQKGYTPETILWDVKTEFNPGCDENATKTKDKYGLSCYHPRNYDGKFRGKISLRQALAQSINLPSVKLLYLAGIEDSLKIAKNFGITTLTDPDRYGLSLVLGGGEVKLLEMVSAYGVFAAEGLKIPPVAISKIEDSDGNIIEENKKGLKRVLDIQTARLINDVLSDNEARAPMFGYNSSLYFKGYQVAAKTGTTQYFNDAWTIGYTPFIVVGVWVGNNNNSPMAEKPGIFFAGTIWKKFMEKVLTSRPKENFKEPASVLPEKPILRGEIEEGDSHSILHYVNKNDLMGEYPINPEADPQYLFWEKGIENWLSSHGE